MAKPLNTPGPKLGDYRFLNGLAPMAPCGLARAPNGALVRLIRINERQLAEARALCELRHENIASVLAVGTEPDPFVVVRSVEGQPLEEVIVRWGRDEGARTLILRAFPRVLEALHYAHKHSGTFPRGRGSVHGALGGDSVRLSYSGDLVLTGFGSFEGLEPHPAFLAPECERGAAAHPRSDIYAAGLLLWQIAAGRNIVMDCDGSRGVQARLGSLEAMVPGNAELRAVILRAMRREPNERYATARQMQCDLARAAMRRTSDLDWDDLLVALCSPGEADAHSPSLEPGAVAV